MSFAISILAVAVLAVQLGLAIETRRAGSPRPAEPAKGAPVRMAADVG